MYLYILVESISECTDLIRYNYTVTHAYTTDYISISIYDYKFINSTHYETQSSRLGL